MQPDDRFPGTLTLVDGVTVGHAQDDRALTGVTVVRLGAGAVAALEIRGGAASTRQTTGLDPDHVVDRVHAFCLAGGSAYGLAAADGVMAVLEAEGIGFDVGGIRVPIVPSAVIFDLRLGDGAVRPDAAMGARAARAASSDPVTEGCVGAGLGASIGKLRGIACATKGGLGSAAVRLPDGLVVGALAVVNAFGDVRDPVTRQILAGARRSPEATDLVDTEAFLTSGAGPDQFGASAPENTTLGVVVVSAALSATDVRWVARLAADAFPRVLSPGCTRFDGDLVLAAATGRSPAVDPHRAGVLARQALEVAIVRGVWAATAMGGIPAAADLRSPVSIRP
jgi:L-aminopeptidase/D-esterase-like protein